MLEETIESSFPCVPALARVCQLVIGDVPTWPAWPDLDALALRFESIPAPRSHAEAVMASGVLLQFTPVLGELIHQRLHAGQRGRSCGFDPGRHIPIVRVDPGNPAAWSAAAAFRVWTERYGTASAAVHDHLVERARQRLGDDLSQRLRMLDLARELACSIQVLRRRFISKAGETPLRYRARLRAIEAVRLLRRSNWKMDAVAQAVGWKSRKDLYGALADFAGLSPSAIRAISDVEAAGLISKMTPR